jgi:hypothetical protein
LQKEKAVVVLKEIGDSCKFLNPQEITLETPSKTEHFEIHIKCHVDDESWECLKQMAKKHDLGIRLTDHTLVIYAPMDKKIGKLTLT